MVSRKDNPVISAKNEEMNPIVLDKVITSDSGEVSLHIVLNLKRIQVDRSTYSDALKYIRNLPFDIESVQGSDPIALYVASQRPSLTEKSPHAAMAYARQYYERHLETVEQEAFILAVLTDKSNAKVLNVPADPYTPAEDEDLPGVLNIPEPVRDLNDPVEARLRNFYGIMDKHRDMVAKFYAEFNLAMAKMAEAAVKFGGGLEETDEAGFQPNPVN